MNSRIKTQFGQAGQLSPEHTTPALYIIHFVYVGPPPHHTHSSSGQALQIMLGVFRWGSGLAAECMPTREWEHWIQCGASKDRALMNETLPVGAIQEEKIRFGSGKVQPSQPQLEIYIVSTINHSSKLLRFAVGTIGPHRKTNNQHRRAIRHQVAWSVAS